MLDGYAGSDNEGGIFKLNIHSRLRVASGQLLLNQRNEFELTFDITLEKLIGDSFSFRKGLSVGFAKPLSVWQSSCN